MQASVGSADAVLSGFLQLVYNPSTGTPGFDHFASPVGALVPFTDTFHLESGGWDATTFDAGFNYTASGQVNFVSTPEPPNAWMAVLAALAMVVLSRYMRTGSTFKNKYSNRRAS